MASVDDLLKLADRLLPGYRAAVTAALKALGTVPSGLRAELRAALLGHRYGEVEAILGKALSAGVPAAQTLLANATKAAAEAGAQQAAVAVGGVFNLTNPAAASWAAQHAGELIADFSSEQVKTLRVLVSETTQGQLTTPQLARAIRTQVHAGLNARQATAFAKYSAALTAQASALPATATARRARLLKRVDRYRDKLLRQRAHLIANTEVATALARGQQLAWQQARAAGRLGPRMAQQWIVTKDDTLCDACKPMALHPLVPLGGMFTSVELGKQVVGPPLHPNCRCQIGLKTMKAPRGAVARRPPLPPAPPKPPPLPPPPVLPRADIDRIVRGKTFLFASDLGRLPMAERRAVHEAVHIPASVPYDEVTATLGKARSMGIVEGAPAVDLGKFLQVLDEPEARAFRDMLHSRALGYDPHLLAQKAGALRSEIVPLDALATARLQVPAQDVREAISGIFVHPELGREAWVIRYQGRSVLAANHPEAVAARLRGKTHLFAKVLDLDDWAARGGEVLPGKVIRRKLATVQMRHTALSEQRDALIQELAAIERKILYEGGGSINVPLPGGVTGQLRRPGGAPLPGDLAARIAERERRLSALRQRRAELARQAEELERQAAQIAQDTAEVLWAKGAPGSARPYAPEYTRGMAPKVTDHDKKEFADGVGWLNRNVTSNSPALRHGNDYFRFDVAEAENYASAFDVEMRLVPGSVHAKTVAHEMGHMIEDADPVVRQVMDDFFKTRTRGKSMKKLSELLNDPAYDTRTRAIEYAYADTKFIHPYMAKPYPANSEILSMGLQYLKTDPWKLATEDPEMFDLLMRVIRYLRTGVMAPAGGA